MPQNETVTPLVLIYTNSTVHATWMTITFVSTILYVYLAVVLYKNKHRSPFDSSFFRLWRNLATIDVLGIVKFLFLSNQHFQLLCIFGFSERFCLGHPISQ